MRFADLSTASAILFNPKNLVKIPVQTFKT